MELIHSNSDIRLTVKGVDPSNPLGWEAACGQSAAVYQNNCIIVATDSSLKGYDSMPEGAFIVSMRPGEHSILPLP